MAVEDLWINKDGTKTARYGEGLRYRVRYRRHPAKSFRTKSAAERHQARILDTEPVRDDEQAPTIATLLDRWLATKAGLRPRSYQLCRQSADACKERWGALQLSDLTRADIQAWLAAMPNAATTKRKRLQALAGCIDLLLAEGGDLRNPCNGIKLPASARRDPVFMSRNQLHELAAAAGGEDELMILVMGKCGLRIGEVCGLHVEDFDPKRRRVRVRRTYTKGVEAATKSGRARDVPVPPSLAAALEAHTQGRSGWMFGPPHNSDQWRRDHFKPAAEAVGRAAMHPHELRHTAASLAIAAGADPKMVQQMLGHSSAAMTLDIYSHLWDQGLDDVAARMD